MRILPLRAAILLGCGAIMAMAVLLPFGRSAAAAAELNALVWCDHSDPNLLKPFEEANGVKVNVKEFEGTGAGLAIVDQSQPGDWDVMVIDSIDVPRGVEKGLFEPLPEDKLPFADLYPAGADGRHRPRSTASATASPRNSATTPSATTRTRSTSPTCSRWPL